MIPEAAEQGGGLLYTLGAAVVAIGLGARYMLTQWKQGAAESQRADAEIDVIAGLREEVKRLSDQNDKLAKRLNEMQDQSVLLRDEISALRVENGQLRREIGELHKEIERLRKINDEAA